MVKYTQDAKERIEEYIKVIKAVCPTYDVETVSAYPEYVFAEYGYFSANSWDDFKDIYGAYYTKEANEILTHLVETARIKDYIVLKSGNIILIKNSIDTFIK